MLSCVLIAQQPTTVWQPMMVDVFFFGRFFCARFAKCMHRRSCYGIKFPSTPGVRLLCVLSLGTPKTISVELSFVYFPFVFMFGSFSLSFFSFFFSFVRRFFFCRCSLLRLFRSPFSQSLFLVLFLIIFSYFSSTRKNIPPSPPPRRRLRRE